MFNSFPQPKPDSGGSNIKSIQRGTLQWTGPSGGQSVTISAVDTTKAIVKITFRETVTGEPASQKCVAAYLSTSTTVQFEMQDPTALPFISWEVIEFSPAAIKSLQSGYSTGLQAQTDNIAISAVNLSKAMLFFSYSTGNTETPQVWAMLAGYLSSATNIAFTQTGAARAKNVRWYVVEFN